MKNSIVERVTDNEPDGIVFEGSREECERFVELQCELNSLTAEDCPQDVFFFIDGEEA